ncbi:chitinase [Antheraea pernyi nucleopolyhedrovirus]|uniref:Chitinase n=2 Tax=Antheraea pernyi nuclear polyhedrosis virus TaxID=161494 RepID=Q91CM0_NPVAP|nr:chitinase [Antheraea pernyi nucleopolyhedrovirus]AWD33551.1 chitinase [Antheraea proylei nucleopolyhedrovirus]BAX08933.1 chitinase [Antheraea yamamai nucleopolyhedrovirus]BBD50638.1 chitinase [Samia cynthia nucleopolyhedrovirus]ABF50272.1 chitinase [Antheraea pernyi nucleopolyhedrovirus]AYW35377.1 v-chi [Antheraea proylei nucleopolyhedrovirus]
MVHYLVKFLWVTATVACASPGTPVIDWADRNYALVKVNPDATAYENLIQRKNHVSVQVSWNVWNGGVGDMAYVLFNDKQVWKGDADAKKATVDVTKSGQFSMRVKVCDEDGCSVSEPVLVKVADTDGGHLSPLEYIWRENNKPNRRQDKTIAAYFVEWGVYGRNFPVDKVPLPNLSHLLYGFIPICGGDGLNDALKTIPGSFEALQRSCQGRSDFKVAIHDPWAAVQKPQKGVSAWNEPYKGNFGQLMAAKLANPHLKILPSIGGWTLSDPFYYMHDAEKRRVFVDSVREFLQVWKFFDGVDIDWEFPGGKGANPTLGNKERDADTYNILLKELRVMLDELQLQTGKTYELTSAISAGHDKIAVVKYDVAQKFLDKIFLMSYDFKGAWSNIDLGYQTTLYAPSWNPNELYNTDHAVKLLTNQGVDPRKIIVGVAMYGRGWTGVSNYENDNYFLGSSNGPVSGTWEDGVVDYRQIKNEINKYIVKFDNVAKAAYVFDKTKGDLISYDSVDSVIAKGRYVEQNKLGGLFAWEIDADNGDLLNAMNIQTLVKDEL